MTDKTATGWERDNRTHFDEIVATYNKARWEYPVELYSDIMAYLQTGDKKAVEIGAGTGIATAPFINAGYSVTAVEMGVNMAAFIKNKFRNDKNFNVIVSDFESVDLPHNAYDLAYAASAFHWVDAKTGCPKVFNLLKSGGTFALFRNNAVPLDDNILHEEIQGVYKKYYYKNYKPFPRPIRVMDMSAEDFLAPMEVHRGFRFESMEAYGFESVTMKLYKTSKTYSAEAYLTLLDTYSDHRALPDDDRAALYTGIKEAILRHGNQHELCFIFQLYMGRKP
ncbi:MAG: class I SAM-dependent methyltransferase [Clostridiales bacterium]|nr:class I SAM-dependent methyltransferase [Clostridiales bacterium]